MKKSLLLMIPFFVMFFSSCRAKVEVQTTKGVTLSNNQIGISANASSTQVQSFVRELEAKQALDPSQVFEVVSLNNSAIKKNALSDDHLYPNKNFYIFLALGDSSKDRTIQKADWDAIYYIMNYVAGLNFRVMINAKATSEHLRYAAADKETSVILWSSHGNKQGFYDSNGEKVPYDVFDNKSPNFYQFILSSCEGRIALDNHYNISGLRTYSWSGLTNSSELKSFIISDAWSIEEGKNLVAPVAGLTCTMKGNQIFLMNVETRIFTYGYHFENLSECSDRLATIKDDQICRLGEDGMKKVNTYTLEVSEETFSDLNECLQ